MNYEPTNALEEGMRLLQAGDFTGAIARLQQAAQQNPQDGRAYGYMGVAYARLGDINSSLWALQESARLQPQDSAAHYNLAVGLAQAQRTPEARAALEQALLLDPNNTRAQIALQSLASVPSASSPLNPVSSTPHYAPTPAPEPSSAYSAPTVMSLNGEPVAASSNYAAPAPPPVAPLPGGYTVPTGTPAPGMGGMQYAPQTRPLVSSEPPTSGKRILRGLGWGALFGQWWTLWVVFWDLIVHGGASGMSGLVIVILSIVLALFFGFVGSIMGLIIGAIDAMPDVGAIVGVVFGILLLGGEYLLSKGSSTVLINVIFWGFTGDLSAGTSRRASSSRLSRAECNSVLCCWYRHEHTIPFYPLRGLWPV